MKESHNERLLRLWKARQEAEGHDVSGVTTLKEAEHFFNKKPKRRSNKPKKADQVEQEDAEEGVNDGTGAGDSDNESI